MGSARIGIRIAAATLVAVAAVSAYLLPQASIGYTFGQENGFTLTIDSSASYNGLPVPSATWTLKDLVPGTDKFFNFDDIKPGDQGEASVSFHVNMDAFLCVDFTNLQNLENGINEPESHVDVTAHTGELAPKMEFFAWKDDGDNIFEPQASEAPLFGTSTQSAIVVLNDTTYTFADPTNSSFLAASSTAHMGIMWCAGNLVVDLVNGASSCDPTSIGNEAQTDKMSVDISFRAATIDQGNFLCEDPQDGGGDDQGLGEEIGLFVKCELIASYGWPMPDFSTECPDGFGAEPDTTSEATTEDRTRPPR